MAERVTFQALLASTSLTSHIRVSGQYRLIAGGVHWPIRITSQYKLSVVDARNGFFPDFLQSGEIYGIVNFALTATALIPEHNPYRPTVPESIYELGSETYDYLRENQEILRQQHNITQAGDSTFPWQLFSKSHSDQQFNLGSIARFYHGDWGLIQARYVLFEHMIDTTFVCAPVGLLKNDDSHSWTVTNRLDLSHPDLVVGMIATLTTPANGEYGWVIVDGPNLQEVENTSPSAETGETLAWSQTGAISTAAQGRVIGRRINKVAGASTKFAPGQLYIELESHSLEAIKQAVVEATANLEQIVLDLQEDVETLKSLTVLDETFQQLNATLARLQTQIDTEKRERKAADTSINNRISNLNFVTAAQLGSAVSALQNALAAAQVALNGRIDTTHALALQALQLAQANGYDPAAIEAQISAILESISILNERPKGKFPVVTGSIPPTFVYTDDGSLVYTETF